LFRARNLREFTRAQDSAGSFPAGNQHRNAQRETDCVYQLGTICSRIPSLLPILLLKTAVALRVWECRQSSPKSNCRPSRWDKLISYEQSLSKRGYYVLSNEWSADKLGLEPVAACLTSSIHVVKAMVEPMVRAGEPPTANSITLGMRSSWSNPNTW
jgi:hypothetical protein